MQSQNNIQNQPQFNSQINNFQVQPQNNPQPINQIIIQAPQQITNQPQLDPFMYTTDWSHGLCDCCSDCSECIFAYCCYGCFISRLHKRAGECSCTPCCCPGSILPLTAKVRGHYKIRGSIWTDCLKIYW